MGKRYKSPLILGLVLLALSFLINLSFNTTKVMASNVGAPYVIPPGQTLAPTLIPCTNHGGTLPDKYGRITFRKIDPSLYGSPGRYYYINYTTLDIHPNEGTYFKIDSNNSFCIVGGSKYYYLSYSYTWDTQTNTGYWSSVTDHGLTSTGSNTTWTQPLDWDYSFNTDNIIYSDWDIYSSGGGSVLRPKNVVIPPTPPTDYIQHLKDGDITVNIDGSQSNWFDDYQIILNDSPSGIGNWSSFSFDGGTTWQGIDFFDGLEQRQKDYFAINGTYEVNVPATLTLPGTCVLSSTVGYTLSTNLEKGTISVKYKFDKTGTYDMQLMAKKKDGTIVYSNIKKYTVIQGVVDENGDGKDDRTGDDVPKGGGTNVDVPNGLDLGSMFTSLKDFFVNGGEWVSIMVVFMGNVIGFLPKEIQAMIFIGTFVTLTVLIYRLIRG